MTIAMLSLAGFPATAGFFGKLYLIEAAVDNAYAWLGVVIVLGSAISLVYYLRVIAAVWMRPASDAAPGSLRAPGARPAIAGGSPEADDPEEPRREGAVPARREGSEVAAAEAAARPGRIASASPRSRSWRCCARWPTVAFGIYPEPLFDLARDAGAAIASLV